MEGTEQDGSAGAGEGTEVEVDAGVGEGAGGEAASDELSFLNLEHIPEEHRSNYETGIKGLRERLEKSKGWESEREGLAADAELARHLSSLPGFKEFMDDESIRDFEELLAGRTKPKADANGNGGAEAPSPLELRIAAIEKQQKEHRDFLHSQRKISELAKSHPESVKLMQEPRVDNEVTKLVGQGWPLDAAYERATRDDWFKRELEKRSKKPPGNAETTTTSGQATKPPQFNTIREGLEHSAKELAR